MDLAIKFPSPEEKVLEETARFRALTQFDRNREIGEMFELYHVMITRSGRADHLNRLAEQDEIQARQAIFEVAAKFGTT